MFRFLLSGFFFCLTFTNIICAQDINVERLSFQIAPVPGSFECINVVAKFEGPHEGTRLIRLPPGIRNVRASAHGGLSVQETDDHLVRNFILPNDESLVLEYQQCGKDGSQSDDIIARKGLFYSPFNLLLATPENDVELKRDIHLKIEGFSNKSVVATSYGYNERETSIKTSIDHFRFSILIVGELHVTQMRVNNNPVVLLYDIERSYFAPGAEKYIKPLLATQREFWGDNEYPYYLVVTIQECADCQQIKMVDGTHRVNAVIMVLPDGDKHKRPKALWLLSHEFFHNWVGLKMHFPALKRDLQWFLEGFTDYYGLLLAQRSGVIGDSEYLEIFNGLLKTYFSAPQRFETNAQNTENLNADKSYNLVAQLRGHILAQEISADLLIMGKPELLDNVMKQVYSSYKSSGKRHLGWGTIDTAFMKYLGKKEWARYKDRLLSGKGFDKLPLHLSNGAKLVYKNIEIPEFGFNLEKMLAKGEISELSLNSPAYKAGLREGQKIINAELLHDAVNRVSIFIEGPDARREITFIPNVKKTSIPNYVFTN